MNIQDVNQRINRYIHRQPPVDDIPETELVPKIEEVPIEAQYVDEGDYIPDGTYSIMWPIYFAILRFPGSVVPGSEMQKTFAAFWDAYCQYLRMGSFFGEPIPDFLKLHYYVINDIFYVEKKGLVPFTKNELHRMMVLFRSICKEGREINFVFRFTKEPEGIENAEKEIV